MTYQITPENLRDISEPEKVFGTTKFLPEVEDIPPEFHRGNQYTELAQNLFFKGVPKDDNSTAMILLEPFTEDDLPAFAACVYAHLRSWSPKHEHKIAGVGYMISKVVTLKEI